MSNNKQSSVEFLLNELQEIGVLNIKNCHWSDEVDVKKAIEQAKAMREKEIKDAFDAGEKNVLDQYSNPMTKVITSEQYYNETFNNNEQQ